MDTVKDFILGPPWAWTMVWVLGWIVLGVYVAWPVFYVYEWLKMRRIRAASTAREQQMLAARDRMEPDAELGDLSEHIVADKYVVSVEDTASLMTVGLPRRTVVLDGQRVSLEEGS